jgi:hypothetical protein
MKKPHKELRGINIVQTVKERKANWIVHVLGRSCIIRDIIEGKEKGKMEVKGRRERRHKQLLNDLTKKRSYWNLKEEIIGRTVWRTRFGRGCGHVSRQTT